jgi:RND family efflux transporter MFP subunit
MMEKSNTDSPPNEAPGEANNTRSRTPSIVAWGITAFLVVVIAAVIVFAGRRNVEKPAPQKKKLANVEAVTVVTEEYCEALTLPALVEADRTAAISPESPGTLARWFFPEGATVEAGQIVAELNIDILMANLEELKASLKTASENATLASIGTESASLELENAQKRAKVQELVLKSAEATRELAMIEFKRIQTLVERKIENRSKLDTVRNAMTQADLAVEQAKEGVNSARVDVRSANLRVKQSKANLNLSNARLLELEAAVAHILVRINKSKLRAPITGRLEEHLAEPGEVVAAGVPIAHVYDLRYLRAIVNVPDRYVAFLDPKNEAAKSFIQMNRPGAEQQIRAKIIIPGLPKLAGGNEPGIEFDAEIAHIAQSSDPESNTFQVELRFPNPGRALRHGVIARGRIEYLIYPSAIIIPAKAAQVTDVGPRVLVLDKSNGAQRVSVRDIEPISIRGSKILIGSGLVEGDRLIVSGWKGLVGGEEVNVLVEDGRFMLGKTDPDRKQNEE